VYIYKTPSSYKPPIQNDVDVIGLRHHLPKFIPREKPFKKLEDVLLPKTKTGPYKLQKFVLWGTGGTGKSELACYFANHHQNNFSLICWLDYESLDYICLAEALGININSNLSPDQFRNLVFAKLENRPVSDKPWLLIYDNVLKKIPFPKRGGFVLCTSIDKTIWSELQINDEEQIKPFNEEEALSFLKQETIETNETILKDLIKELDAYPLALAQATAYIRESKKIDESYNISKYLSELYKSPSFLSRDEAAKGTDRHPEPLRKTWELTLERLKNFKLAFAWLNCIAYLDYSAIPKKWLMAWLKSQSEVCHDHYEEISRQLLITLLDYGVIHYEEAKKCLSLHRLMQEAVRLTQADVFSCYQSVVQLLIQQGQGLDWRSVDISKRAIEWIPHGRKILENDLFLKLTNIEKGEIYFFLGKSCFAYNDYEFALKMTEKALEEFKIAYSDANHLHIAAAINAEGENLLGMGKIDDALTKFLNALEMRKLLHGEIDHTDIAESLNHVGLCLCRSLQYYDFKKSLKFVNEALDMWQRLYPNQGRPEMAFSLTSIGMILYENKQYQEAYNNHQKALIIHEQLYQHEDHPHQAYTLACISACSYKLGDYKNALKHSKLALEMNERLHPRTAHADTARSLDSVSANLYALKQYPEALEYGRKVVDMWKLLYPEQPHADTAQSLDIVSANLFAMRRYSEALEHGLEALKMNKQLYPDQDHPDTATSYKNVGMSLNNLGRDEEALPYLQKDEEMRKKISEKSK
jgi:tetratricopeptide (TPR) repeat protein